MTASEKFEHYVKQVTPLAVNAAIDPEKVEEVLQFINEQIKEVQGKKPDEDFFIAERAFYSKEYEKALKGYLLARAIPHFQFYCFRASAYISMRRGQNDKALNFAKKALSIYSEDPFTKTLIETLSSTYLQEAPQKIPAAKVAIGKKEMEELAHIFQENQPQKELFSCEFESSYDTLSHPSDTPSDVIYATRTEAAMNMDFFSPSKDRDTTSSETLTKRLYALKNSSEEQDALREISPASSPNVLLEELKKMAESEKRQELHENQRFSMPSVQQEKINEEALQYKIKGFKDSQTQLLINYFEEGKARPSLPDHCLYVLHGWNTRHSRDMEPSVSTRILLTDQARKSSGGFFLRWNGKGIAINPGENFLKNFHEKGLHIKDIDFVIVTRDVPEMYSDVKEIYHLNTQLNKISSDFQLIHYYLNPKAYQQLSPILKPNFKQERHTVLPLELFLDSPDVEKIELTSEITLHYFPSSKQETYLSSIAQAENSNPKIPSSLGIKLDLKLPSGKITSYDKAIVRLGYLSGAGWTPLLSHYLGTCDVLITEFGNTTSNDYGKMKYNEDSLGFFGTVTLLEEIHPKLLLSAEFGGREGDIRLEALQKIRLEHSQNQSHGNHPSVALPADHGLFVDLKNMQIQCSLTKTLVDPQHIRVVKSADAFGDLHYLSPPCFM